MNELAYKILASGFKPGATDKAIAAHVQHGEWTAMMAEHIEEISDVPDDIRIEALQASLMRVSALLDNAEMKMLRMWSGK